MPGVVGLYTILHGINIPYWSGKVNSFSRTPVNRYSDKVNILDLHFFFLVNIYLSIFGLSSFIVVNG